MGEYFEVITDAATGEVTRRPLTVAEIAELTAPPSAQAVREQRDLLLVSVVDPLVSNPLRWADLKPEQQAEWVAYRRALLDIPQQAKFPKSVVWPIQPA